MSRKRLDDIGDFHRHGYVLRIDCLSCKRVAVLDPLDLVLRCQRNGWSRQLASVDSLQLHASCCVGLWLLAAAAALETVAGWLPL